MKIAFFELENWEVDYMKDNLKGHNLKFFNEPLSDRHVNEIDDAEIICVFVYSSLTSKIINALPKLKAVITMSTGYDHIDCIGCKKRGIKIMNVPSYGEHTVAEHTFGLILALSRKLYEAIDRTEHDSFSLNGLRGFDLKGKTIGIIGAGRIGQHVIRIAYGFDMKILVLDRHPDRSLRKYGVKFVPLNKLLRESDIVTLHVPLVNSTYHLINKKTLNMMKDGSYLINTSRGGIVDTKALLNALEKRKLAGAGLDVLEGEEDLKDERQLLRRSREEIHDFETFLENHLLIKKKNVIVTPHNAFNTQEALERILDTTINNIHSFVKGRPINLIKV